MLHDANNNNSGFGNLFLNGTIANMIACLVVVIEKFLVCLYVDVTENKTKKGS